MTALLQAGEDASVVDARGRPPYAVPANKEVRDAFRRHVASAGDSLTWDVEAAGIPSALTPEMEAQQAAKQVQQHGDLWNLQTSTKLQPRNGTMLGVLTQLSTLPFAAEASGMMCTCVGDGWRATAF